MTKTLVTGGTGLVGSHLLYFLVQQGLSPIAIKRESSDILNVEKVFSYYTKSYKTLFQKIIWEECDILDFLKLESKALEYNKNVFKELNELKVNFDPNDECEI